MNPHRATSRAPAPLMPVRLAAGLTAAVCLGAFGGPGTPPCRVAFTPAFSVASPSARETRIVTLSLFLQEALGGHPDFRAVPEERVAPVLAHAFGGAWDFEAGGAYEWMRGVAPLDVYIDLAADREEGRPCFAVASARGVAYGAARETPAASAEALIALLADTLKLPAASVSRLTAHLEARRPFFTPYYLSQRQIAGWGENTTDVRLRMITAFPPERRRHPLLASRVAALAVARLAEGRGTRAADDPWVRSFGAAAVFSLLGTPLEPAARPLVERVPALFEPTLPGGEMSLVRRCGALRALGWLRSARGRSFLEASARDDRAEVRLAAAAGIACFTNAAAMPSLSALADDAVPAVAYAAVGALRARGYAADRCAARVRALLAAPGGERPAAEALQALADAPTAADIPAFQKYSRAADNAIRLAAATGLCRLQALDTADLRRLLDDPDPRVVTTVLTSAWPHAAADASVREAVIRLANEPAASVADPARAWLAAHAPTDRLERARLDLETAHPYARRRLIERLAADPAPEAFARLTEACANRDPHARAAALAALGARAPERARPLAVAALTDGHGWVRFHAAVLLARHAAGGDAAAIRAARDATRDPAARLYLDDALARTEGRPPPPPPPAAHAVTGAHARVWMCGIPDSPISALTPYTAYYTCAAPQDGEHIRRAHAAGKAIFPRVAPIDHPGRILLDPVAADRFWLRLREQLPAALCAVTDGVVYGEESMDFKPDTLWAAGWREFCREAGIAEASVNGDIGALTPNRRLAWRNWAQRVSIEGFNELYAYTKLYYGKLRPGIQVATFLPNEYGFPAHADKWRFDVGGYYLYGGDNRSMYGVCRVYRTLWPDRPVIWLANGAAETEHNAAAPVLGVRYPVRPITARWDRSYADNLGVWLAGADPGYFSSWSAWGKEGQCVWLSPEGLHPGLPQIDHAATLAFAGTKAAYQPPALPDAGRDRLATLSPTETIGADDILKPHDAAAAEAARRLRADRETYRRGHFLFALYNHDTARLFAGLPRHTPRHPALLIGPVSAPACGFLTGFDALPDLAALPSLPQGLEAYRLIGVRCPPDTPARIDAAGSAMLRAWLRDTPGLLLVEGALLAANTDGVPTAAHPEGEPLPPWPWEGAVAPLAAGKRGYRLTGNGAQALSQTADGAAEWVLWRDPAWRGAVVFDTGAPDRETAEARRVRLNAFHRETGIGIEFGTVFKQLTGAAGGTYAVAVSYNSGVTNRVAGIDLLTGLADQAAGPGRESVLAATSCQTDFVVLHDGVLVWGERPLRTAERISGGVRVEADGWARVRVTNDAPDIRRADGTPLPAVAGDPCAWLFDPDAAEGVAVFPADAPDAPALHYFRAAGAVTVRARKAPPPSE